MRVVIQRVTSARVFSEGKCVGQIGKGLLLFYGVHKDDCMEQVSYLVQKIIHLRLFEDAQGKMNLSLKENGGALLVVSQFTLYGDCTSGRRPSLSEAAPSDMAVQFYEQFIEDLKKEISSVEAGIFGAYMQVELVNDGPVTFIIDAKKSF